LKPAQWFAVLLLALAISASADTYSVSTLAFSNGSAQFGWNATDAIGTSTIASQSVTSGSEDIEVPFVMTLALPSASTYLLSSASLTFSATDYTGAASSSVTSSSSAGGYISGVIPCQSWSLNGDCPVYSNSYTPAAALFEGSSSAVLTGISDASFSWTGSVSGGTLNLVSLGFGSDLEHGGMLILTGYRDISASLLSYSNTGFNASTNFLVSYNGSGQEYATLSFSGVSSGSGTGTGTGTGTGNNGGSGLGSDPPAATPEPQYLTLVLFGIIGLIWSFRRRIRLSA